MKRLSDFNSKMKLLYRQPCFQTIRLLNMKTISLALFLFISFNFFSQQCLEIEVFGQPKCNGQSSGNGELYIQSDGGVYLSISNFQSALSPYSWSTSGTGSFTITSDSTATYYPSNSELLEWCQNQGPETTITATSSINTSCSGSFLAVFWSESFAYAIAYDGSVDVLHNAVSLYQGDLFSIPDTIFVDICPNDSLEINSFYGGCAFGIYNSGPIYSSSNENIEISFPIVGVAPCIAIYDNVSFVIKTSTDNCCQVDGFNVITPDDCSVQSYTFTPQTICSNYIWDFGDGSSLSTGNYVAHEFPNEGQYEVCLYGVDSLGNIVDSVCEIIDISLNCNVSLYNTNQDNTGGLYVNAYGACNFIYDYGDGSPLSTYSFHQYSDIGNYNLCVYGYDVNNEICDTLCEQINITIDTNCQINGMSFSSGQWSCVGNLVDCYVSPFGNAASYLYDFGDGSPITDYLSHWYSEIGIYEVCVFAVNGFGDICDSVCENYEVTEIVDSSAYCCMADFTYTQDNCTVQFTNLSEGNYDDMRWTISLLPYSFIDTTLYGNNPTFTFENSGDYLVTVEPLIGGNYCDTMFRVIHVDDCQPLMYNLLEMQSILIYPNPTTNLITIQSESVLNNKFKIYDQQGREVMKGKLKGKNTEVSLVKLSRGTYTIQVEGNYKPAVIIKQ